MQKYDFKKIENNWKDKWYKNNLYKAVDFSPKPKKYILAELPYPSGHSLHIGHAMRYSTPEIYSRYLRMKGYNVLFPMGWDSFGLPTEGYALKEKKTPQEVMKNLAVSYKKAMQDMGYAIDWDREINTCDPNYYKWTQWLFLKFYEHGLAQIKEMPVWWCKELGNLADEEVVHDDNGERVSERGGYKVERKMYKQWVLKIPEYAEKLLQGLDKVDFSDSIKTAQRNWIGKSEGINIEYDIEDSDKKVTVFTTRPDTNFGATFIALAPEHPLVEDITQPQFKKEVEKYVKQAKNKSDLERITDKKKTGVFTGSYAINNLNGYKIPLYISDYVLYSVGTGAVVGVPGHDKRDFEFAVKMKLPVVRVVVGKDGDTSEITNINQVQEGEGTMVNSGFLNGMDIHKATTHIMDYLEQKGWGKRTTTYKIRDWVFARQRYWGEPIPMIYKQNGELEAVVNTNNMEEVHKKLPVELPFTQDYEPLPDGSSPLSKIESFVNTRDSKNKPAKRETQTMPTFAGSSWYFIRYVDPKNSKEFADFEKIKYWFPVDKYFGGAEHTTGHLLYSRFWMNFFYDLGLVPYAEPYNWRMNGGLLLGEDGRKMSKRWGNVLEPAQLVEKYGADATRTALCFIGPYDETYPWNEGTIKAVYKLLTTIYSLRGRVSPKARGDEKIKKEFHKMVKNITGMLENLKTNTAVSEIMIFVKELKSKNEVDVETWKGFIKILAPFAPFLAEELWQEINGYKTWKNENSVHVQPWPEYDEKHVTEELITIPIQINGKVRAELSLDPDTNQQEAEKKALSNEKITNLLNGQSPKKIIYIKGKIINIVL